MQWMLGHYRRKGLGRLIETNGNVYIGDWKNDMKQGKNLQSVD